MGNSKSQPSVLFEFQLLGESFAICRLSPDAPHPDWATGSFVSVTRTKDEVSVVCAADAVPPEVKCEPNWRCLRISGSMDFELVGVVASFSATLADANLGIFVVSTFDTDYVLVKTGQIDAAISALRAAGHTVLT